MLTYALSAVITLTAWAAATIGLALAVELVRRAAVSRFGASPQAGSAVPERGGHVQLVETPQSLWDRERVALERRAAGE